MIFLPEKISFTYKINIPMLATNNFSLCTRAITEVTPMDNCSSICFNLSSILACKILNCNTKWVNNNFKFSSLNNVKKEQNNRYLDLI